MKKCSFFAVLLGFILWGEGCLHRSALRTIAPLNQWEGIRSVAVLPVQNATGGLVRLSYSPGFLASRWSQVRRKHFVRDVEYEGAGDLTNRIEDDLVNSLEAKNYQVLQRSEVEKVGRWIEVFKDQFALSRLRKSIPADAYLLVIITDWEGDAFAYERTMKAGFNAMLIRGDDGYLLWQAERERAEYRPYTKESELKETFVNKDIRLSERRLYVQYRKEILGELSHDILESFPPAAPVKTN